MLTVVLKVHNLPLLLPLNCWIHIWVNLHAVNTGYPTSTTIISASPLALTDATRDTSDGGLAKSS